MEHVIELHFVNGRKILITFRVTFLITFLSYFYNRKTILFYFRKTPIERLILFCWYDTYSPKPSRLRFKLFECLIAVLNKLAQQCCANCELKKG